MTCKFYKQREVEKGSLSCKILSVKDLSRIITNHSYKFPCQGMLKRNAFVMRDALKLYLHSPRLPNQ